MKELDSNLKNHSNVTDFIGQTSDSKKLELQRLKVRSKLIQSESL